MLRKQSFKDYTEFDLWNSYYSVGLDKFYVYNDEFNKVENLNFKKDGIKLLHSLCTFIYCRSNVNGGAITFIGNSSISEDKFYDEGSINYVQASNRFTTAHHTYAYLSSSENYTLNEGCLYNSKFKSTNMGGIYIEKGSKTIKYYNCSNCESGCNSCLCMKDSEDAPNISFCNFISNAAVLDTSCFVVYQSPQGNKYSADHFVMLNNTHKGNGGIIESYYTNLYIDNSVILGNPGSSYMFYTSNGKIIISNSIVDYMTSSSANGAFESSNISHRTPNGWEFKLLSPSYLRHSKICTKCENKLFCSSIDYIMILFCLVLK